MNELYSTRKFTEEEFDKLKLVTDADLSNNVSLVTRTGDAHWYHVFDTPDGKHMAVKVVDVDGIQQTFVFHIKYIHRWFKIKE